MTHNTLTWQQLQPYSPQHQTLFEQAEPFDTAAILPLQPRLHAGLSSFCRSDRFSFAHRFMLLKADDDMFSMSLLCEAVKQLLPIQNSITGSVYHVYDQKIIITPAKNRQDNFAATDNCLFANWVESEQLFGCVRHVNDEYKLTPGLVHKVNGGILIIPVQAMLYQPLLWLRLKSMVMRQQYQWYSQDETRPLSITIPPMPLNLRVILVGDRNELSEFQELEPSIYQQAQFSEFESEMLVSNESDWSHWFSYIKSLSAKLQLPEFDASVVKPLVNAAGRTTEDQKRLPLSPLWLSNLFSNLTPLVNGNINGQLLADLINQKRWQESYLAEQILTDLHQGQINVATTGKVVGQINGLSVIEFPGHPLPVGEPSRISCAIYLGDGEITDIDRKAELAGQIHAKGMMIMQAFIAAELATDHQLPYSASLVFEQTYSEIDGDSASLAGLCALMSALSLRPIKQEFAVTGSVDQFGQVQAIGGINEKIESFFYLCQRQGLTGNQGVIIPISNVSHLCLADDIVEAVKNQQFHIYAINHVQQALPLLTGIAYDGDDKLTLLSIIQERIYQAHLGDKHKLPWFLRWLA